MFKVVLVANDGHPLPEFVAEMFAAERIDFSCQQCYGRDDLEKHAADANVIWLMSSRRGLIVEENLDVLRECVCVVKVGSGTDNIDHSACTKRGIIVTHTPDDPTEPTSDHFIAMLFTAVRQTARQDRLVRSGVWDARAALPMGQFTGADLGLIGFGRIGRAIVRKLSGFEMNVRIFDPCVTESEIDRAGARKVDLDELLTQSQYVLICCPFTRETKGLIGEIELRMMRPDAVLVNVARAGIVDENSLVTALKEGRIKGAAFDVLEKHPLNPGDEMLELENLNLTPHMGGYPHDYPDGLYTTVVQSILDVSRMRMPRWIVNKDVIPKWQMKSWKEGETRCV